MTENTNNSEPALGPFQIKCHSNDGSFELSMGITNERGMEIVGAAFAAVVNSKTRVEAYSKATAICQNPNELAMCIFAVDKSISTMEDPEELVKALLGRSTGSE